MVRRKLKKWGEGTGFYIPKKESRELQYIIGKDYEVEVKEVEEKTDG